MDKKSQHVGNHGGAYIDNDGMRKQFTMIDHDKKLQISTSVFEKEDFTSFFIEYRKELVQRILDIPASICPLEYQDFTIRGEGEKVIRWDEIMVTDKGLSLDRLRSLAVLLENRSDYIGLTSKVIKT